MMREARTIAGRVRLAPGLRRAAAAGLLALGLPLLAAIPAHAQKPAADKCSGGELPPPKSGLNISVTGAGTGESQPDLEISTTCIIKKTGDYYYANVNIIKGGTLIFQEPTDSTAADRVTNFWAKSIVVENGGAIRAGDANNRYGKNLYTLNIILYGNSKDDKDGIACVEKNCGVPEEMWTDNGKTPYAGCGKDKGNDGASCLPGQPTEPKDYFYQYGVLHGGTTGYYGSKVLAVGYGGTLQLYGLKGTTRGAAIDAGTVMPDPGSDPLDTRKKTDTGTSWTRLAGTDKADTDLAKDGKTLMVDHTVGDDWQPGDHIVVTTTDYLPGHSEELIVDTVKGNTVTVKTPVKWPHVGHKYDLSTLLKDFKSDKLSADLKKSAETRAAVALLTRSIRIISGGDVAKDYFECPDGKVPPELAHDKTKPPALDKDHCATLRNSSYYFGGQAIFRQGFQKVQLQGVEFHQLGQGGMMGRYPVHFHIARRVPPETYIKDSSVSESMTRWYVLHSTQGVLLQRNVGWKSIGHGYYLESGTEADNDLYANIGIYARAAVKGDDNPRNVPGILANNDDGQAAGVNAARYRSDVLYPTAFWISNGWNELVGNMAAGAGTCGTCFWLVPEGNSDMVEVAPPPAAGTPPKRMNWTGYAGRQASWPVLIPTLGWDPSSHGGETPIKLFYKNYCSTAMHSLNTVGAASDCLAVGPGPNQINQVPSMAPRPKTGNDVASETYYPDVTGNRVPTVCDPSLGPEQQGACTGKYDEAHGVNDNTHPPTVAKRCDNSDPKTCGLTAIDHYTTSFNWAETNFSAVWLRTPGWFLFDNSFISDVQNGGLTLVTGGDYSRSSTPIGYWGLASNSIFVGATQPKENSYALASGPHDASGNIICDRSSITFCISKADSVAYPLSSWATNQRFFNIYDGPAYQDSNAYLNINVSDCDNAKTCMYFGTPGVRKYPGKSTGYLPNAAIGWKQPNGFYYPPAFHSDNLFFNNVDIRHYVIEPLYLAGTYLNDDQRLKDDFIGLGAGTQFKNYTDIDRQTELTDDDGSLTGLAARIGSNSENVEPTISVNEDAFFGAPTQASECKSNKGVNPDKACKGSVSETPPTARTSPYEYVTTVIYPGCAMKNGNAMPAGWPQACGNYVGPPVPDPPGGPHHNRYNKMSDRGGTWSRDCGGPFCTGVPIYRQFLTATEWQTWSTKCDQPDTNGVVKPECDFPFARMAGASLWQRDVMTVNNGTFYIDTTRSQLEQQKTDALGKKNDIDANYVECPYKESKDTACEPRSVNTFEKGQTYYVFFLFATPSIKQKYQFYVGKNFNTETGVKGVKVNAFQGAPYSSKDWTDWKSKGWSADLVTGADGKTKDVLEVTVDFSKLASELDPTKGTCQPGPFCSLSGNTCGCNETSIAKDVRALIDPNFKTTCKYTCENWAARELDCPADGCFGFAFTLPDAVALDKYQRPKPSQFPTAEWSKFIFSRTKQKPDSSPGGACYYDDNHIPGKGNCKSPD